MFRTAEGVVNRPANFTRLPEYPIPKDLEMVLNVNEKSELSRKSLMYSKILKSLFSVDHVDLSEHHYVQLLKLALYLEEYQGKKDMKERKMIDQTVERSSAKDGHLFTINVEEMDEEQPWIRESDFVDVTDTKTNVTYTLKVTKVEKNDVVASDDAAEFCKVFQPNNTYNIGFRFNNYPLKCAPYALEVAARESSIAYLFPLKAKPFIKTGRETYRELEILNPSIETNHEQKQAVLNILNKSSFPAPYILYGPPGTGKTATLIETICQIKRASPKNRILVCTPSNTAADEVAKRLLKYLDTSDVYRIYSQARDRSTVDEELQNSCWCGEKSKVPLRREDIAGKTVLISTLCTATKFVQMQLSADYFSHIIIDEAGQGTEPDMLIPIGIASKNGKLYSQVVLAGDPQQLGPTVISKLADIILGRSILERLMSYDTYKKDRFDNYNPRYITKLLQNYRSHPSITHIYNELFYDDELVAKYSYDDQNVKFPVMFFEIKGEETKVKHSPSKYNYEEIAMVLKYVDSLMDNKTEFGEVSGKDIGIITPFKLQSERIKKELRRKDEEERRNFEHKNLKNVRILKRGENLEAKANFAKVIEDIEDESGSESSSDNSEDYETALESEDDDIYLDVNDDRKEIEVQEKNGVEVELESDDDEEDQDKRREFKDIFVGTVELFQGQERKFVIMTAVRSKTFYHDGKEHIGFLSNPKRFNVAMSRAQNALIVIGNPRILQKDDMWHYLLKYCVENGSYHGLEFALRDSNSTQPMLHGLQKIASTESLFGKGPLTLYSLGGTESSEDISKTIDAFVKPDKAELKERVQKRLRKSFVKMGLHEQAL